MYRRGIVNLPHHISNPNMHRSACVSGGQDTIRGNLFAAVEFLEQQGVSFLAEDFKLIPRRTTMEDCRVRFIPPLEYRENNAWKNPASDWKALARFNRGAGLGSSGVQYASPPGVCLLLLPFLNH